MAGGHETAGIDLSKELICSICADVLFQPLTLLDCLHTFCGACLKEWFAFQASQATTLHPYTCPSCRAPVRSARPDAKVNTYLDLWLKANPNRGKSEEEKVEERKKYKLGDNVLPKLRRRGASDTSDDRRLVDEVRELSLRDIDGASGHSRVRSSERRRRERHHSGRSRSSSRHRVRRPSDTHLSVSRPDVPRNATSSSRDPPPEPVPRIPAGRQVEHQSSLRSLLSNADDPAEIEEEIMRQILEDGLLDGLDLSDIDLNQEDEISQRIATAFRQRQEIIWQQRPRRRRSEDASAIENPLEPTSAQAEMRRNRPPEVQITHEPQSSHPPVSRPHLFEAAHQGHGRRRRSASQSSSRSLPLGSPTENNANPAESATRPTTELGTTSDSSATAEAGRRNLFGNDRRTTDPEGSSRRTNRPQAGSAPSSAPTTPRAARFEPEPTPSHGQSTAHTRPFPRPGTATFPIENSRRPSNHSSPSLTLTQPQQSTTHPRPSSSSAAQPQAISSIEPSISCSRCGKQNIQYDLHYNCRRCESGKFNICLRCYRLSRGCLHWYGFGSAAWQKYERLAPPGGYPPNTEPPHVLTGHRYLRTNTSLEPSGTSSSASFVPDDPAKRLQAGVFCDNCFAFANSCYWKCDVCNDGEWGFCDNCVNQRKHCTHPLLPLTHKKSYQEQQDGSSASAEGHLDRSGSEDSAGTPHTPRSASILRGPGVTTIANLLFRPLTFSDHCDICGYPIPPSHTRFHCPKCNDGNYDICLSCYTSLVNSGKVKQADGHLGWRRCPQGHRMVIVGFEDRDGGQRRVVVKDVVGGQALKEDEAFGSSDSGRDGKYQASWKESDGTRRTYSFAKLTTDSNQALRFNPLGVFPPDGGVGLRLKAEFTFYPADGVKDELSFPKGAEITEAEDINGDWLWGVYCANKGLIPGNYVKRIS